MYKNHSTFWSRFLLLLAFIIRICLSALLLFITGFDTVSAQPHTIVKLFSKWKFIVYFIVFSSQELNA